MISYILANNVKCYGNNKWPERACQRYNSVGDVIERAERIILAVWYKY